MDPLAETLADDGAPARRLAPGQRVFGRYELVAQVGRGGMGVVWRARDNALGGDVALKFVPDLVRWDAAGCAGLKAETRRALALAQPNIVRVHGWVEDSERAAIAMEYVEGQSLAEVRLSRPGQVLTPAEILGWLPSLCSALDYAHGEGKLVHRDIKPSNLLLAHDGTIKLADFGVARGLAEAVTRTTQAATSGTLLYMSPQQALGEPPAPSDDIYALGATLYELLTGRPPFYAGHVLAQIQNRRPESLTSRRRALGMSGEPLPATWEKTVAACLAKRPERRPASAGQVAETIRNGSRAQHRWRSLTRPGYAAVAASLVLGASAAWWWWSVSPATRGLDHPDYRRAESNSFHPSGPPRALTEYLEDFSSGLGGWAKWGEPLPQTAAVFQGRRDVFDNHGDGMHSSGITSTAVFAAPDGFTIQTDLYISVSNPAGCHLAGNVGLTANPNRWMDTVGAHGDDADGLKFGIEFTGDACWGSDPSNRRHAWFLGQYLAEDGTVRRLDGAALANSANADEFVNRWVTLKIEVAADRSVQFRCEGKLVWAPEPKLHPGILSGQRLVVSGRSLGSAGKAYHDSVRFHPTGDRGTLEDSGPPLGTGTAQPALPWSADTWEALRAPEIVQLLAAPRSADAPLRLTAGEGRSATLRSRREFARDAILNFSMQPLLQSGAPGSDVARLGWVAKDESEAWRFVGLEFRAGEVWLIDKHSSDSAQRIHRLGTYAPGAWVDYTLRFDRAAGIVEVVGSLAYAFTHKLNNPSKLPLRIEATVADSADGVLLRPVRAAEPRPAR